jgi:hypothetical protein
MYTQFFPFDHIEPRISDSSAHERVITKNELHNYGLLIQEAKKTPNSVFFFVGLQTIPGEKFPFDKEYARLKRYAKKELGEKLIFLPPAFGYRSHCDSVEPAVLLVRNILKKLKFSPNVSIEYTGQFGSGCARRSAERMEDILVEQKIEVTLKKRADVRSEEEIKKQLRDSLYKEKGLLKFTKWRRATFPKTRKH